MIDYYFVRLSDYSRDFHVNNRVQLENGLNKKLSEIWLENLKFPVWIEPSILDKEEDSYISLSNRGELYLKKKLV